jgi:hypothetical protein
MKCSMFGCGSHDTTEISKSTMTPGDRASQAWHRIHPVTGVLGLAHQLAKITLTRVYRCNTCGHTFRKF